MVYHAYAWCLVKIVRKITLRKMKKHKIYICRLCDQEIPSGSSYSHLTKYHLQAFKNVRERGQHRYVCDWFTDTNGLLIKPVDPARLVSIYYERGFTFKTGYQYLKIH